MAPLLAHQYGWDEMLYVIVPITGMIALVRFARNKAQRLQQARMQAQQEPAETPR